MENLIIRKVKLDDLNSAYRIESECFPPSEAASKENIEKRIKIFPQGFLVCEIDNKVIGYVNSGSTNTFDITDEEFKGLSGHEEDGKNIVIFSLAVIKEFQNKGIASRLLNEFVNKSRKMRKEKILLLCKDHLINYYQKNGFLYFNKSKSNHGGSRWHEMYIKL